MSLYFTNIVNQIMTLRISSSCEQSDRWTLLNGEVYWLMVGPCYIVTASRADNRKLGYDKCYCLKSIR